MTHASEVALDDIQRELLAGSHMLHPDPDQRDPSAHTAITTQTEASAHMDELIELHLDHHEAKRKS